MKRFVVGKYTQESAHQLSGARCLLRRGGLGVDAEWGRYRRPGSS